MESIPLMTKSTYAIFFVVREWCKKRGHKSHFDLMENAKENAIYNNLLSNAGCYDHIGPSLPSLQSLFAEAAHSLAPAQHILTLPTRLSIRHLGSVSLSPGYPTPLLASKGGL